MTHTHPGRTVSFNMHAKPAQTLADDSGGRWDGTDLRPSSEPVECSLSPDLITVLKGRAGPPGESLRSHAQSNFEQTTFLCTWTLLLLFPGKKKNLIFVFCLLLIGLVLIVVCMCVFILLTVEAGKQP